MKRLRSSDSVCGLISNSTDHEPSPRGYGSSFQTMLDNYNEEEDEDATIVEEYSGNNNNHHHHHIGGGLSEKKRRLRTDQVKALEKNFELENKLEPERKTKLAQELGLQPRQVAVWFQNRRARWKTKQLEKDYGVLKNQYDSLRLNFDSLRRDNESLLQEINKLKAKINGEEEDNNKVTTESEISGAIVKEEEISLPEKLSPIPSSPPQFLEHSTGFNYRRSFTDLRDLLPNSAGGGSSDSCDSSVIESSSDNGRLTPPPPPTTTTVTGGSFLQFVKMEQIEDHDDFLSGEEACGGFFSDEQPPSLHWYSAADHWT